MENSSENMHFCMRASRVKHVGSTVLTILGKIT